MVKQQIQPFGSIFALNLFFYKYYCIYSFVVDEQRIIFINWFYAIYYNYTIIILMSILKWDLTMNAVLRFMKKILKI